MRICNADNEARGVLLLVVLLKELTLVFYQARNVVVENQRRVVIVYI